MTCKDCSCYKECYLRVHYLMDVDNLGRELEDIEKRCSKFVPLPSKEEVDCK